MPCYDYECSNCSHVFEIKQGFNDEPVAICPKCAGRARRLLYAPPIIFKGSGFYCTDSRKNKVIEPTESATKEKKEPAKSESPTPKSQSSLGKG